MIDPTVIDAWLKQPRRDSSRAKQFTRRALEAKVAALEPKPDFVLPPFTHQLVCFLLCAKYPGYVVHMDMGTGKTKAMIDSFRWRKKAGQAQRALVLVPSTSNVDEWGRELQTHGPDLETMLYLPAIGAFERVQMFFHGEADVFVMTYKGFLSLVTKDGKPWDEYLRKAAKRFQFLICDESTAIKNPQSLTFRSLRRFVGTVPFRYCLSGTPANMNMQDLWSQFYVADGGETLGKTLGWYRQAFFREKDNGFARVYEIRKRRIPKLHRIIRHGALRYEDHECQDLPERIGGIANPMLRRMPSSIAQGRRAAEFREEVQQAAMEADTERVENAYYRMRCLSSGYIPTESGFHDYSENPKLDALMQLLAEGPQHHWLVFFHYKHTADLIIRRLKAERLDFVEVSGRVANKSAALRKFRGNTRIMLGSGAAALGLNLQHCSRTVFFETPDSIAVRLQAEKRTHRHGQRRATMFYDLAVLGTYDERILEALRTGKRVLDAVVDGKESC